MGTGAILKSFPGWWPAYNQALSPDQRLLATVPYEGGPQDADRPVSVRDVSAPGGAQWQVGVGVRPVWSPDSTRLAYLTGLTPSAVILMVCDVYAGRRWALTTTPQEIDSLIWSPDGQAIVYTIHQGGTSAAAASQLWIADAGQPYHTLPGLRTRWIGDMAWLPAPSSSSVPHTQLGLAVSP
jgi:Tol biopolymer transport system component